MLSALSKWILDRLGWTIVGRYPREVRKMIVVVFADPFFPTGDKDRDFRKIIDFFKVARGRHPERGIDEQVRYR